VVKLLEGVSNEGLLGEDLRMKVDTFVDLEINSAQSRFQKQVSEAHREANRSRACSPRTERAIISCKVIDGYGNNWKLRLIWSFWFALRLRTLAAASGSRIEKSRWIVWRKFSPKERRPSGTRQITNDRPASRLMSLANSTRLVNSG